MPLCHYFFCILISYDKRIGHSFVVAAAVEGRRKKKKKKLLRDKVIVRQTDSAGNDQT